ncbi:hypothetical protein P692DRAFT_20833028 [Suillus brevipes Sb2]|nr:hypothetical protein P692DRAFT_20833028 [Suillus brevipes Sb2]
MSHLAASERKVADLLSYPMSEAWKITDVNVLKSASCVNCVVCWTCICGCELCSI